MERTILDICRTVNPNVPDDVSVLLFDEGYIDSFGAYAILVQLELEFKIEIGESDLNYENFKCMKNIMELVNKKRENYNGRNKE